jgi:predicted ATPase
MPFIRHVELRADASPDRAVHPFDIPAVASLGRLGLDQPVTMLVGENGAGKSTLIEAIAILTGFNPEGGSKNFTARHRPSESSLHEHLRLARGTRRERTGFFLRAETMFNVATEAEAEGYGAYGWERIHEKSHGEAFLWVATHRFAGNGLYLLDEPESALSPSRQLAFLRRMHDLVAEGSQFIVSTHSPILMAYPGACIYGLGVHGIARVAYEDTEHYEVTRDFLLHRDRMLHRLLNDEDGDA